MGSEPCFGSIDEFRNIGIWNLAAMNGIKPHHPCMMVIALAGLFSATAVAYDDTAVTNGGAIVPVPIQDPTASASGEAAPAISATASDAMMNISSSPCRCGSCDCCTKKQREAATE